jgi:hypothetical protein
LANMAKAPDLNLLEQLAALDKLVIWTNPVLNEPYWKKEISLTMLDRLYTSAKRFYDVTEELYSPDEKLLSKLLRLVNPSPTDSQKAKLKELSILMKLRYPRILAFVHQEYSDVYIWIKEPGGEERTLQKRSYFMILGSILHYLNRDYKSMSFLLFNCATFISFISCFRLTTQVPK